MIGLNLKSILVVTTLLLRCGLSAETGVSVVPIANKNIEYKAKIYSYDVRLIQENKK